MKKWLLLNQGGGDGNGGSGGGGGEGAAGSGGAQGGGGAGAAGGGGAGGAGSAAPWHASLPEALSKDPSIGKFKSMEELAAGYVNLQRLVGSRRLEAPQDSWTDKEWGNLYDQLGRPSDLAKYQVPSDVKLPDTVKLDEQKLAEVRRSFHELGLSEKQGSAVLGIYAKRLADSLAADESRVAQERQAAEVALRGEFGDQFDTKLAAGQKAIQELGGEELRNYLNTSGLGNNVHMVRAMIKLGEMLQSDSSQAGGSGGGFTSEQSAAIAEIASLKGNKEFMAALLAAHVPGHNEAMEKWRQLHYKAYPGKQGE